MVDNILVVFLSMAVARLAWIRVPPTFAWYSGTYSI